MARVIVIKELPNNTGLPDVRRYEVFGGDITEEELEALPLYQEEEL